MRISLEFELDTNSIDKKYRDGIISFFKKTFSTNDKNLYLKYYGETYSVKNFTFAVYLDSPKFTPDGIVLNSNTIKVNFSIFDACDGIDIYNAFLKMRNVKYPLFNNFMTLKRVKIENTKKVSSNAVLIKMISPLIVRTNSNGKNRYLNFKEDGFTENLNQSVKYVLDEFTSIDLSARRFEILPISARKTVVNAFGSNITANIGVFKIVADVEVINAIYQLGIGSRRSEGFGMFEIIS